MEGLAMTKIKGDKQVFDNFLKHHMQLQANEIAALVPKSPQAHFPSGELVQLQSFRVKTHRNINFIPKKFPFHQGNPSSSLSCVIP